MYDDYLYKDLTYKIIGVAFSIHKTLGPVHKEIVYQNALVEELTSLRISFKREEVVPVEYNGKQVGVYKPDFIVDNKVIVELKAEKFSSAYAKTQLSYYLKGTKYKIGLLLNFGTPSLEVHRRIYDKI